MTRFHEVKKAGNWMRNARLLVLAAAALVSAGSARAQTCDAGEPWVLNGSDTLESMIRQSIINATADATLASCGNRCQTASALLLKGTCSTGGAPCSLLKTGPVTQTAFLTPAGCGTCTVDASQACTTGAGDCPTYVPGGGQPAFCGATSEVFYAGGGSTTGETNLHGNLQTWAPMSRIFRDTRIFTSSAQTTRRSFCSLNPTVECTTAACPAGAGVCNPRNWDFIYARNVVALDAGVIVTKQGGVKNIQLPIVGIDESQAAPNTSPVTWNFLTPNEGYTQLLAIVLGGVDGSGSFAACADPRRINAVQDLAALQGTPSGTINHFYRRDDNSGTTDTFKEKLRVDRFCNGRAVGINGTNKTNTNLNNQDYDPIRRPCAVIPGQRATACTDVTVTPPVACSSGPTCTQGLVVALSVGDNDTTLADVTATMGSRVDADADSVAFAGRAAVKDPAYLVSGPSIRTRTTGDNSVRLGLYMLSRRLFVNYADWDGDGATATGYGATGTNNTTLGNSTAAPDAVRIDAEGRLWNWMTADRFNYDPVARGQGFITCDTDPGTDVCGLPGNLCCTPNPAPLFAGAPAACVPGSSGGGPAFWPIDDGNPATNLGGLIATSTSAQICCSNLAVIPASSPANTPCPEIPKLAVNSACAKGSDCLSGVCADGAGIGITYCQ